MIDARNHPPQAARNSLQDSLVRNNIVSRQMLTPLPTVKRFYHPELDALRATAFFMVFCHHAFSQHANFYTALGINVTLASSISNVISSFGFGLPLFFFLSAFLITKLLLLEIRNEGTFDIKSFYTRRILRIWPLYYVAIVLSGIFEWLKHGSSSAYSFLLPYSMFFGNWFLLHNFWPKNPGSPLWSISVEEQFYLLLPLIITLAKPKMIRPTGVVLIAISLVSLYIQGEQHLDLNRVIWCNTLSQAIFFGLGILLATVPLARIPSPKKLVRIGSFILAFVLFFISSNNCYAKSLAAAHSGTSLALGYILAAAGCSLLFYSFWGAGYTMPKSVVFLGKISFGLYIFHEFAMEIMKSDALPISTLPEPVRNLLSLPLDIAFAAASYTWLEKPFLTLRTRFTHVSNRPL
jgi:peptidoglycan/LPS O-acetylase OafA/YrhL